MTSKHRGFTLVEMLMAMFLFAVVGGAIYGLIIRTQRLSRAQAERGGMQDNVRIGGMILPAELHELGYDGKNKSDVLDAGPNHIRFRAMRGMRVTCHFEENEIRIRNAPTYGSRDLLLSDGFFLFVEGDANLASDDRWLKLNVTDIKKNTTCGGAGTAAATTFTLGTPIDNTDLGGLALGAPLRYFETMQLGLHTADGKSWLGARSISKGEGAYQPVLGPLDADSGISFTYLGADDVPVTDPDAIRTVEISLQGRTDTRVHKASDGAVDFGRFKLNTRVALRNALRP